MVASSSYVPSGCAYQQGESAVDELLIYYGSVSRRVVKIIILQLHGFSQSVVNKGQNQDWVQDKEIVMSQTHLPISRAAISSVVGLPC